jgi:hypothetical protein
MKANKFDQLSPEDQHHIIDLCNKHGYAKVVGILAQPRPEGMALNTSTSALCRFYTQWNPVNQQARLMEQLGKSLRVCRQATPLASLTGVLAILENNVLKQLQDGRAAADLEKEINIMTRVHRALISEETLNHKRGPFDSRSTYFKHVELQAGELTDNDFDYNDRPREDGRHIQPADDTTPEDLDIEDVDCFKGQQNANSELPLNAETYKKHIEYRRPLPCPVAQTSPSAGSSGVSPHSGPRLCEPQHSGRANAATPTTPTPWSADSPVRQKTNSHPQPPTPDKNVLTFPNPVTEIINSLPDLGSSAKIPSRTPVIPQIPHFYQNGIPPITANKSKR